METTVFTKSRPWWHLQQANLGSSPQGRLCLLPPQTSAHRIKRPAKCYISTIPDELLAQILEHLSPPPRRYHESRDYKQTVGLLTVCKHWQRIYESLIYRCPDLGGDNLRKHYRTRRLFKTLSQRPELGERVRRLDIVPRLSFCGAPDYETILGILQCCKLGIRSVFLHVPWERGDLWGIVRCFKECIRLHTLELSGYLGGLALQTVLDHLDMPTLKDLTLSRYGCSHDKSPGAACIYNSGPPSEASKLSLASQLSNHSGQAAVITLKLRDPYIGWYLTNMFVQWPAQLVNFELTSLTHSPFAREYSADAVQIILQGHRESLEIIELGILVNEKFKKHCVPDFSGFPRLHSLQVSGYNLLKESPVVAAAKLSGSCMLKSLSVSFCTEDQHQESPSDFGPEQARWFEDFVTAMITEGREPKGRRLHQLELIRINFNPETYVDARDLCTSSDASEDTERWPAWPWEYVEQTAKSLNQLGVQLKYTPRMSKQEWFGELEKNCQEYRQHIAEQHAANSPLPETNGTIPDYAVGVAPPSDTFNGIERYFELVSCTTEKRLESSRTGYRV